MATRLCEIRAKNPSLFFRLFFKKKNEVCALLLSATPFQSSHLLCEDLPAEPRRGVAPLSPPQCGASARSRWRSNDDDVLWTIFSRG